MRTPIIPQKRHQCLSLSCENNLRLDHLVALLLSLQPLHALLVHRLGHLLISSLLLLCESLLLNGLSVRLLNQTLSVANLAIALRWGEAGRCAYLSCGLLLFLHLSLLGLHSGHRFSLSIALRISLIASLGAESGFWSVPLLA